MCDNCKHPREKVEAREDLQKAIIAILALNENYTIKTIIEFITGKQTKTMKDFRFTSHNKFGLGKGKEDIYWHSIIRQGILNNYITKEIEQYGVLKISKLGHEFLSNPIPFSIPLNRDFTNAESDDFVQTNTGGGAALDDVLLGMLLDLRKQLGKKNQLQPWIIFQEPALQDMATYYPISMNDLLQISGISQGKAAKYGNPFIELIKEYVEENDIERPSEIVIKQVANKSKDKVTIIQGIDRKLPFEDIARSVDMTLEDLIERLNIMVEGGTKLDINYFLEDNLDEDIIEEIFDYFHEAESASLTEAFEELKEDDISMEELSLVRIKFMSEVAN